ncbi:tetratricopeptide repeat protein [Streptomyces siamensis]|uniref:Tetratricopeptide repeat protein n=1 Tax=Streptomyces siamensis TaxID=1274986 RepID=A0ABP9JPD7_9ACTN
MAREKPSLQSLMRKQQQPHFVARRGELDRFAENLALAPDDPQKRFLVHVHGPAGVGKTTLVEQFRHRAQQQDTLIALTDETSVTVLEVMQAISRQCSEQGVPLKSFDKLAAAYWEGRLKVEAGASPESPEPSAGSRAAAQVGIGLANQVPLLGLITPALDSGLLAQGADQLRQSLVRTFRDPQQIKLVTTPVEVLTPVFVEDFGAASESRDRVTLFFDTHEKTAAFLDPWLIQLLSGRYGPLPVNVVVTLSGQNRLDQNRWARYLAMVEDVPLSLFSDEEARQLLDGWNITDEPVVQEIISLSGGLPLLVMTLAASRPSAAAEVGDPSDTAVGQLLKWVTDPVLRDAALSGALPRRLDEDALRTAVAGDGTAGDRTVPELLAWLRRQPFISEVGGECRYHDLVRTQILRLQRRQSPRRWRIQHSALASAFASADADTAADRGETQQWQDDAWQRRRCEETYHRLCAGASEATTDAVRHAVRAAFNGAPAARRWSAMLYQAGQDGGITELSAFGRRLTLSVDQADSGVLGYIAALLESPLLDDATRAAAHALRGREYRSRGEYSSALQEYGRSMRLAPERQGAYEGRGETYRLMNRYEDALADFDRSLELEPGGAWSLALRGVVRIALGRNAQGFDDLDRSVRLSPNSAWFLAHRGEANRLMGRYEQALDDLDRAVAMSADEWTLRYRGLTYYAMDQNSAALADFRRASELRPDHALLHAACAVVCRRLGRTEESLADFERAVALSPDDPSVLKLRADFHFASGRYPQAVADLERVIQVSPDDVWAISVRGEALRLSGRPSDALSVFDAVLEHDADHVWARARRAEVLRHLGRFGEAFAEADRALALAPEDDWTLAVRGMTRILAGQLRSGEEDLDRALDINPDSLPVRGNRAHLYNFQGRHRDALDEFERVLATTPTDTAAIVGRGVAYQELGRHHRARGDFESAAALAPDDPWTRAALAASRSITERYEQGESPLDRLIAESPDVEALSRRVGVRCLSGRYAEALSDLDLLRALRPEGSYLPYAAGVLRVLGRFEEASEAADAAVAVDPDSSRALLQRALVRYSLDRFDDALTDLDRVVQLTSHREADSLASRGEVLRSLDRGPEALADLDRAVELKPRAGIPHYVAGLVLGAVGDEDAAAERLDQAERLLLHEAALPAMEARARGFLLLVQCARRRGDAAERRLSEFASSGPTRWQVQEILVSLDKLVAALPPVEEQSTAVRRRLHALENRAPMPGV